jgi:hypothetical protein
MATKLNLELRILALTRLMDRIAEKIAELYEELEKK